MYTTAASSAPNESRADTEEDTESIDVREKYLKTAKHDVRPFQLQWSFGINPEVPLINLTTDNRTLLAYACSHLTMMYDYSSKKVSSLQGHQNIVKTLSTTHDGKWLLTADFDEDCVVIIWDTEKRVPVCTLFNPHGNEGMTAARISPNAKYIVTVGNEKCQNVHFWLWTHGKDKPNTSISLTDTMSERVKEVIFNNEYPEEFVLTTDYHVLFLTWSGDALSYDCPKSVMKLQRVGIFNGSCYVPKMQQIFTATTNGYILIWGNVSPEEERKVDNRNDKKKKKKHIKTVNLQKSSIIVIIDNEGMLVTANTDGRVIFYDYQLKLLFWYDSCGFGYIRWISFDLRSDLQVSASAKPSRPPTDATLQRSPFNIQTFLACSFTGVIALIDIPRQKYYPLLHHSVVAATSLDTYPGGNYVVVGDAQGTVHLYNYETLVLTTSRSTLDFQPILEKQIMRENIAYVTSPETHESLKAVTALKFSPRCDMLACGLENGALWILHHITLDLLNEIPYKHSAVAINKIIFSQCAKYMAYADNALTVVVFKRNDTVFSNDRSTWNLIGKYHSHYLPIRGILFDPVSDAKVPRLFSLGEDQELVEYDLEHSGPYPRPGLKILHIKRIEQTATPLCLAWYPEYYGNEKFFMISNSEYKYKIFEDTTKMIRGTYLGPTIGKPVQHFQVLTDELVDDKGYMVFATDREVGLQLLPFDGNPYKIHSMTGHPQKITGISVSTNKEIMFTTGYNDPCVLMWRINLESVDIMAQLGGQGISPFYCLIEGGKKGWLMNEMKDLFYYAQILHQGECTTVARVITDTVVVEKVPNLMQTIGYFPSNEEIENIMREVCYRYYAETGELREEITFEEFVRLYVNHRPAFGLTMDHTKEAFRTFVEEHLTDVEEPSLMQEQLVDVLLGRTISKVPFKDQKPVGDPLSLEEAYTYLKMLASFNEETTETDQPSPSRRPVSFDFNFLPPRISYKDFTMGIMGVELPEGGN